LALKAGLDPKVAGDIAAGRRPDNMKDDEAALHDLATALYRDKQVSDPDYKAALEKLGERGAMDMIGIIGRCDLVSVTLITMQAGAPNDRACRHCRCCRNKVLREGWPLTPWGCGIAWCNERRFSKKRSRSCHRTA
jgi:hypothetical protein